MKPGDRLQSSVCDVQVIVVRAPRTDVDLRCGGAPMVLVGGAVNQAALDAALAGGTALGKRYADEGTGIEVLCTKPGAGSLTLNGAPLEPKEAKPLPSSD